MFKRNAKEKEFDPRSGAKIPTKKRDESKKKYNRSYLIDERDVPFIKDKTDQDPFWYAEDQNAISTMAALPWNEVTGARIGTSDDCNPGIVIYPYYPVVNPGSDEDGYGTRSSQAYFQNITQGYTGGVSGFDSPDLLMAAIAAEQLMAFLIEMKRAFGVRQYFVTQNNYYPYAIMKALGIQFDDADSKWKDFVTEYNIRASELNSIVKVPNSFAIGDRWEFISSFLFTDSDSIDTATLCAYRMKKILAYSWDALPTGTALEWVEVPSRFNSVKEIFQFYDSLSDRLINDDTREMFSALGRVYSDDQLKKMTPLASEGNVFVTPIVRNDVVSAALHNATVFNGVIAEGLGTTFPTADTEWRQFPLTQKAGKRIEMHVYGNVLARRATGGTVEVWAPRSHMIDLFYHNTSPGNTLDCTAHMVAVDDRPLDGAEVITANTEVPNSGLAVGDAIQRIYPRTEILLYPQVWAPQVKGGAPIGIYPEMHITEDFLKSLIVGGQTNFLMAALKNSSLLTHVNNAPLVNVYKTTGDVVTRDQLNYTGYDTYFRFGEIDHYTIVGNEELRKLQARCAFKLLGMPKSTRSVTK